jgi:NAD+ kinase
MQAVGLVPNRDRAMAHDLARRAAQWLAASGISVRLPAAEAAAAGLHELAVAPSEFCDGLDLVVSLGGDGTMLHTAALVYPSQVPIVGINAGTLGYLNAFEASDLDAALEHLVAGVPSATARTVVECTVESAGPAAGTWYGLNDVVLEKLAAGRMVRLEVSIDDRPFTTYAADGVIVATPTGSTAYNFSARGPIVSPTARLLTLTPVSPHMLFDRSLVLGADESIRFTVSQGRSVSCHVDGIDRGELAGGDTVTCRVAAATVNIVAAPDAAFHKNLKSKFSLPDR